MNENETALFEACSVRDHFFAYDVFSTKNS